MTDFLSETRQGKIIWLVDHNHYYHVAEIKNRGEPDGRIVVRLAVAPSDGHLYWKVGNARILRTSPVVAEFLFDTGARQTLVSRKLADELNLKYCGITEIRVANGEWVSVLEGWIGIKLGGNWYRLPCWIRESDEDCRPNYLGMEGLLPHFMFCLTAEGVRVFRRKPSPAEAASPD